MNFSEYSTTTRMNQEQTKLITEKRSDSALRGLGSHPPRVKVSFSFNTISFPRMFSVGDNAQKVYNTTGCQRKEAGVPSSGW